MVTKLSTHKNKQSFDENPEIYKKTVLQANLLIVAQRGKHSEWVKYSTNEFTQATFELHSLHSNLVT